MRFKDTNEINYCLSYYTLIKCVQLLFFLNALIANQNFYNRKAIMIAGGVKNS